jgi:hypothetical protein
MTRLVIIRATRELVQNCVIHNGLETTVQSIARNEMIPQDITRVKKKLVQRFVTQIGLEKTAQLTANQ